MDKDNMHIDIIDKDPVDKENDDQILHRLRILYLYQLFYTKTDESHGITMNEILDELKKRGISAARKAIYADIKALSVFGLDIQIEKGAMSSYRVLNRQFELPELIALADYVVCSRFFSPKNTQDLIDKLSTLCSQYEAAKFKPGITIPDSSAIYNKQLLINVDHIHKAIVSKKQITFKYYKYVYDYAQKKPKKISPKIHTYSPIALTWSENKYYLIAYNSKHSDLTHFRVDKMEDVEIEESKRQERPKNFKLSEYMKSTFSMFGGEPCDVTLRFHNDLMDAVLDRFKKISPEHDGENHFTFTVPVRVSGDSAPMTFFGWLFQFGTKAQIIAPAKIRDQYYEALNAVLDHKSTDD